MVTHAEGKHTFNKPGKNRDDEEQKGVGPGHDLYLNFSQR